ncbi:cyp-13B1, partial [Pristionchus pacificus]
AIAGVVVAVVAIYQYYLWQSDYWRRRGIPGPAPRLFYGNLKELTKFHEPSPQILHEWTKKYGNVYGIKEGVRNSLVIADIDLINEVFVKQFDAFYARPENPIGQDLDNDPRVHLFESRGSRWKRLRALASPSFSINALKKIQPIVEDSAVKMVDLMGERHGDGEAFDAHRYFNEFTLDTICRLVIGQKESHLFENPRLEIFKSIFLMHADRPMTYIAMGIPGIGRILRAVSRIIVSALLRKILSVFAEIEATVSKRVEERKKSGPPSAPADFIDIFLENEAEFEFQNRGEFKTVESITKAITVDEVISQAFVFLLAGYDTTSNALAYTAWMLSRHPEVMRRCQEEIDAECGDASISYEDTQRLRYLDAVCRETHRFYPLAARAIARCCTKDTRLGGYEIEKGTTVIGDTYAVHFSRQLWGEDADEFRPERWLDRNRRVAAINFLAFGAGPRVCIGMRLAMMEEKIALAHLLRRFDVLADETMTELKLVGCTSVTPERVSIKIKARQ